MTVLLLQEETKKLVATVSDDNDTDDWDYERDSSVPDCCNSSNSHKTNQQQQTKEEANDSLGFLLLERSVLVIRSKWLICLVWIALALACVLSGMVGYRLALQRHNDPPASAIMSSTITAANNNTNIGSSENSSSSSENDSNVSTTSDTKKIQAVDPEVSPAWEQVPHVPLLSNGGDLHYRRVCAPVHSSVLCMIIRYPFEVPMQDPNVTYASPFAYEFYNLTAKNFHFLDGPAIEACKNDTTLSQVDMDTAVYKCLETNFAARGDPMGVLALWTKRRFGTTQFFGTHLHQQQLRIDRYFNNSRIMVVGASPSPHVTDAISHLLLGECNPNPAIRSSSNHCYGPGGTLKNTNEQQDPENHKDDQHSAHRQRKLSPIRSPPSLDRRTNEQLDHGRRRDRRHLKPRGYEHVNEEYPIFISRESYYPEHKLPDDNVTEFLRKVGYSRDPSLPLRNLTLIVEYPIAHIQTQPIIMNRWNDIEELQEGFPAMILAMQSEAGRQELRAMGYELLQIIPYDGLPQFFPSVTHAWPGPMEATQERAIAAGMYPGWQPEYGTDCRGPVPPNSPLTAVNRLSRQAFERQGHDMHWYGQTWEFSNQLWWTATRWKGIMSHKTLLDCTHALNDWSAFYAMHAYFLQAMIDDHFWNLEQQ